MVIYFAHIDILFSLGDFDTFPITEIYARDIRLEEFQEFNRILRKDLLPLVKEKQTLELPASTI